ncbi:MAG: acylphosphatase [Nitrospirota bacterium]
MAGQKAAAEITVRGTVQGVGYRFFTERLASVYGVTGWSMNMPDGSVRLEVEGDRKILEMFIKELEKGPAMARIDSVSVNWKPCLDRFSNFYIKA